MLKIVLLNIILVFTLSACVQPTVDMWTITDIELIEGIGSANDAPLCSRVDRWTKNMPEALPDNGLIMWQFDDERPAQPAGGDWMEASSPYTGYLYNQTGSDAYRCATARVTVERNLNVLPNTNPPVGTWIKLYVVAPHLCNEFNGNKHPGEDNRQALAYVKATTAQNQTTVVFDQVIVASTCGGGLYQTNYGDGFEINLGQWPQPNTEGSLVKQGDTNSLDCNFIIGWDSFIGCPKNH